MKFSRENWIILLGVLVLVSFVFSWIQKWLDIQLQYFLLLIGIIGCLFLLWYKKESKTISIEEAYKVAVSLLNKFRVGTEQGVKLRWAVRHTDQKRFSSSGKVFDLEFAGSPNKYVVQIDAKTGKVVGLALDVEGREPPFLEKEEPVYFYRAPKVKRELKEEVKPE